MRKLGEVLQVGRRAECCARRGKEPQGVGVYCKYKQRPLLLHSSLPLWLPARWCCCFAACSCTSALCLTAGSSCLAGRWLASYGGGACCARPWYCTTTRAVYHGRGCWRGRLGGVARCGAIGRCVMASALVVLRSRRQCAHAQPVTVVVSKQSRPRPFFVAPTTTQRARATPPPPFSHEE